jgi:hypothetical protein
VAISALCPEHRYCSERGETGEEEIAPHTQPPQYVSDSGILALQLSGYLHVPVPRHLQ